MDGLNFQASVNNLTQMDRHQQDAVRTPVINQEQNAELARDEAALKALRPPQPDDIEGKKVDPRQRKQDNDKRKSRQKSENGEQTPGKSTNSGFFLDVKA